MQAWSIQEELRRATGDERVEVALQHLGILAPTERLEEIEILHDWVRGGSETHVFKFSVTAHTGRAVPLILKAYTPTFAAQPLATGLHAIMERRCLLTSCGVKAPKVYFVRNATWLEPEIPYELESRIGMLAQDPDSLYPLLVQLHTWAIALDKLGFSAIAPFGDLRTDDANVYVIDFGADLGSPFATADGPVYGGILIDWLKRAHINPARDLLAQSHAAALAIVTERLRTSSCHGQDSSMGEARRNRVVGPSCRLRAR